MDYIAIIERIEELIKTNRMGKLEFYKVLGISANSYSLWKKGETRPTNDNLEKAADILGCSLEYLMFGIQKEKQPTVQNSELSEDEEELLDLYRGFNVEGKVDALKHLRLMSAAGIYKNNNKSRLVSG